MIGKNDLEYFSRQAQGGCLNASEQQALVREVAQAQAEVERYRVASLGMFDPVRVGQVVGQLQQERDEARSAAKRFFKLVQFLTKERLEKLVEEFPWLEEGSEEASL